MRAEAVLPYVISAAFVGAVLYPMTTGEDSFPLSTYPMFSHGRHDPKLTMDQVVGITAEGAEVVMPPAALGSDEVLQAKVLIAKAASRGRGASLELCRAVATRISASPRYADVARLEVRRVTYDSVRYFTHREGPISKHAHATCEVVR